MNLEAKVTGKGMWWDGQYGGIAKNGQFVMLYMKPNLPTLDKFDSMSCFPNVGDRDQYCYTVYHGLKSPLSAAHIQYVDAVIDAVFPDGGGGGGGGTGDTAIDNIVVDKNAVGLRLSKTDGSSYVIPFETIRANALNFYLSLKVADTNKAIKRDLKPHIEYDVPFDQIDMAGSHSYVWYDRAKNVVVIPQAGTKGDVKCSVEFSFQPTIQEDIGIRTRIYMRELGSSAAWVKVNEVTNQRTASQSTGAMYIEGNLRSYQFPDYPVELRYTFELLHEPVAADWGNRLMFKNTSDGLSVSTTKSAYDNYNT